MSLSVYTNSPIFTTKKTISPDTWIIGRDHEANRFTNAGPWREGGTLGAGKWKYIIMRDLLSRMPVIY